MKAGTGTVIYDLRKRIQELRAEIDGLGSFEESPEVIESANLVRSNEYLGKKSQRQGELIDAYARYSDALDGMLAAVLEIQNDLTGILREQSSLMSDSKPARRKKK